MIRLIVATILITLVALSVGCSTSERGAVIPPVDATAIDRTQDVHQFWGLWQFKANPAKQTLDIIQLRTGDMHLNAIVFLEPPPLVNLTLESLKFTGNIIDADIGLRHPFLGLTEFTGFDVCGIFISNGSVTGFDDPDLRMAGDGDARLLNPDGYSRWWNPAEFPHGNNMFSYKDGLLGASDSYANYNSTLNAYKYFCDSLGPNDTLSKVTLANRGMFSAGQKNIRHYTIDMGTGLIFNYAVDACWVFPTGSPPWAAPDDFPPAANRPEVWNIVVKELSNTLWNDGIENGGNLKLQVDAYDWFNAKLNTVKVESPGNFPPVTSTTPISGGAGYSTYEIEILDATPAEGSIDLLISVVSENVGYGDLLPGKPVTAYLGHDAKVSNEKPPEVEFPVMIDSDKNYWATRFVEDSNGVFHIAATWVEVIPDFQVRWFISTDKGATWEYKGDLANPPSGPTACPPRRCFQIAADQSGGVYLLYGEYVSSYGTDVYGFLKYLDTSSAGPPSGWSPSSWQSKKVFTIPGGTNRFGYECALTVSPSKQILMMMMDERYCDGTRGLSYHYAPNWSSIVDGSNGTYVDTSLNATGTGNIEYMYASGNNNAVYHPGTGHFFYCIGGSFVYQGSPEYTGVCALEFDPNAGSNPWRMVAAFQNIGMTNSGSIMQNYHGDMAVDSAGNVHWVHVCTYLCWPSVSWTYNNVQFRFVHGVRNNATGLWDMSDTPINSTWDYPTPPPPSGGDPNNRANYEPSYINIVNTSNGILLTWLQSNNYPNYLSSLLPPAGSFSEPQKIELSSSEYNLLIPTQSMTNSYAVGIQGEAVGDKLALPFASKEAPTDPRGQLWFTMFTGL